MSKYEIIIPNKETPEDLLKDANGIIAREMRYNSAKLLEVYLWGQEDDCRGRLVFTKESVVA